MSLPSKWTDKIFSKLTLVYGRDFLGRWEGMEICDIKADWSHELDGYENRPKAIAWALDNLPPSKPPTVLEFRKLCNTLPQETTVFLAAPRASITCVMDALAKLMQKPAPIGFSSKEWAHRILKKYDAGEMVSGHSVKCARDALGIPTPPEAV